MPRSLRRDADPHRQVQRELRQHASARHQARALRPQAAAQKQPRHATVIDTNHPAFVYGHLSIYPTRFIAFTGGDPKKAEQPAAFTDLFKAAAPRQDDPDDTIYPKMEVLIAEFTRGQRRARPSPRRSR